MKKIKLILLFTLFFVYQTQAQFTKVSANRSVSETVEKLTAILGMKGLKVFSVIDHQKGAESVLMNLNPSTVIIFGNPAVGTKLMICDPTIGFDLPMKYLVWEDELGKTWIGYSKPSLLANEYNLEACQKVLNKMDKALANFVSLAIEIE